MTTRRNLLGLALFGPLLAACGGGDGGSDGIEKPIETPITEDDWQVATPASQGIPDTTVKSLLDDGAVHNYLYSIVVVRNGKLIGERYYNGAKSSQLRSVASVTKSVSGLLIGQALGDGKISSTADTLAKLLPKELARTPNPYAAGITLQQLLDMRGGQKWSEATRQLDATRSADMAAFALALPSDGRPQGTHWEYSTAASHLMSPILANAYGKDEAALAAAQLFEPMGIKQSAWSRDETGMVHGSFGLQLRTRDLAKVALMMSQGGQWQGKQIVPAAWVADSLTPHVGLSDSRVLKDVGYSNLWWSGTLGGVAVNLAWGYGGQFAIIAPKLNLCIATAAELNISYGAADNHEQALMTLISRFLAALQA